MNVERRLLDDVNRVSKQKKRNVEVSIPERRKDKGNSRACALFCLSITSMSVVVVVVIIEKHY